MRALTLFYLENVYLENIRRLCIWTEAMREAQLRTRERLDKGDMPKIAVDIIMGERAPEMQRNSIRTIQDGRGIAIEALVRKSG